MYQQELDPVGGSLGLTAIFAVLPLLTLFVLLGVLRMQGLARRRSSRSRSRSSWRSPSTRCRSGRPCCRPPRAPRSASSRSCGSCINAIWVYNLTVASGHFDVLRRSFERVSPDMRIQAIIIAFCFGALLEALAGFGTPVAITVVMLMALGFRPIHAAAVALIANTAPVAFGALATPIVTLADGHVTAPTTTRGSPSTRSARWSAGRPRSSPWSCRWCWSLVVDGRRGLRQTWPAALVAGVAFGIAQFVASNYISVPLTDIVASLVSAAAVVVLLRVWQPVESPRPGADERSRPPPASTPGRQGAAAAARGLGSAGRAASGAAAPPRDGAGRPVQARPPGRTASRSPPRHPGRGRPGLRAVPRSSSRSSRSRTSARSRRALAKEPWTVVFDWPGLDVAERRRQAAVVDDVHVQLAAGRRHADDHRRHPHRARAAGLARPRRCRPTGTPTSSCARRSSR